MIPPSKAHRIDALSREFLGLQLSLHSLLIFLVFVAGFYPDPADCSTFYRCTDLWNNGQYQQYIFMCPAGTVFDDDLDVCNWPSAVPSCGSNPPTVPQATTTTEPATTAAATTPLQTTAAAATAAPAPAAEVTDAPYTPRLDQRYKL